MFCEHCKKKISKQRLSILPDTTTCVKCANDDLKPITLWTDDGKPFVKKVTEAEFKQIKKESRRSPY